MWKKSIYFKQDFKNLYRILTNYTDSHQGTLDPDIMISVANILTTGICGSARESIVQTVSIAAQSTISTDEQAIVRKKCYLTPSD